MKAYVAFLRGINISGKNKIAMSDLKAEFERLEFSSVSTYLNSGNVIFSSENEDIIELRSSIETMIKSKFGLAVPICIIAKDYLEDIINHSPEWWGTGDKDKYDNLIFIITEDTPEEICHMLGPISDELESAQVYKNVIFWTFDRKSYQKCKWWKKTASIGIAGKLTIRTATTVRKLCK